MIKYLGSKRLLIPSLQAMFESIKPVSAVDVFTGTTRVAQSLCRTGAFTYTIDTASYSEILSQCYVEADCTKIDLDQIRTIIAKLNQLAPTPGYFTEVFCEKARYFHPKNGARIDAIRDYIEANFPHGQLRAILLTSLLEAADRVDSTVGLQMAYLKQWAPRALKDLELRVPELTPGTGKAIRGDALEKIQELPPVDLAYLDPPYNQHRYYTNYHIWETLVRWDHPEYYGVACKRVDAKDDETKSVFNKKNQMPLALAEVVKQLKARTLILSFNNEGFVPLEELIAMCDARGGSTIAIPFKFRRHVGAKIGIHSPSGEKVGTVGKTENLEYIILNGQGPILERMRNALGPIVGANANTL
ncbi:DNA methyltransferase [Boudabousia tangfeifanii]|uniref:site-specific DNA-methyltransferase (adenine-specific) n=1 Tax=Boudabousia tangfeifanii TaxID=1912795 RepID=A0A1D9MIT3_9ACTO|nr:DNA adenine methylase [Boudabousia tangfeifanii]AOZ72217.1 DNA methyltransferase [Boudabousia tangfeifanii]